MYHHLWHEGSFLSGSGSKQNGLIMCNMEGGIFTVIFHANITSLFNCDYLIKLKLKKTQSIITIRSKNIHFLRCFLKFCQPQNMPHCQQGNLAKFVAAPNCPTAAISPWVDDFMRHTPPDNRRGASPFANPPPLVFKGDSGCFYFFSYILRNPFSHDELTKVQFFFTILSLVPLINLWRQAFKGRLRLRPHVGPPVFPPHLILTFSLCWQRALQFRENSRRRIPLYPKRAPVSSGDSIIETLSHKCVLVKNGEVKIVKFLQF